MVMVNAELDEPLDQAKGSIRHAAAVQGWAWAEGESADEELVFKKGVSLFSWGSEIRVRLASVSPSQTSLVITTRETWAFTDWGRGRRAAQRLLDTLAVSAADWAW
jgi:hypothetical protein